MKSIKFGNCKTVLTFSIFSFLQIQTYSSSFSDVCNICFGSFNEKQYLFFFKSLGCYYRKFKKRRAKPKLNETTLCESQKVRILKRCILLLKKEENNIFLFFSDVKSFRRRDKKTKTKQKPRLIIIEKAGKEEAPISKHNVNKNKANGQNKNKRKSTKLFWMADDISKMASKRKHLV